MSDLVLVAIITSVPTSIFGVVGIMDRRELKREQKQLKGDLNLVSIKVDGRLSELLEITRKSSRAEGVKQEKDNPS